MYLVVNKSTNSILSVQRELDTSELRPCNGTYVLPVPQGARLPTLSESSYVLNAGVVDSGSVVDQMYQDVLQAYPMFSNVLYNPLITADHLDDLDTTSTYPDGNSVRAQTGRSTGSGLPAGLYPNSVAILPANTKVATTRPGLLLTKNYDLTDSPPDGISSVTGVNRFMVWYHVLGFDSGEDIRTSFGGAAGTDQASIRYLKDLSQNPSGFSVKVSVDGGNTYADAFNLQIFSLCDTFTQIKVAFINNSSEKIYLAGYAILV